MNMQACSCRHSSPSATSLAGLLLLACLGELTGEDLEPCRGHPRSRYLMLCFFCSQSWLHPCLIHASNGWTLPGSD